MRLAFNGNCTPNAHLVSSFVPQASPRNTVPMRALAHTGTSSIFCGVVVRASQLMQAFFFLSACYFCVLPSLDAPVLASIVATPFHIGRKGCCVFNRSPKWINHLSTHARLLGRLQKWGARGLLEEPQLRQTSLVFPLIDRVIRRVAWTSRLRSKITHAPVSRGQTHTWFSAGTYRRGSTCAHYAY